MSWSSGSSRLASPNKGRAAAERDYPLAGENDACMRTWQGLSAIEQRPIAPACAYIDTVVCKTLLFPAARLVGFWNVFSSTWGQVVLRRRAKNEALCILKMRHEEPSR